MVLYFDVTLFCTSAHALRQTVARRSMSGVPFGPAARIAPIKGADEAQNQLQRQSSQKFGVPSSPPRAVKSFEQVYKPATAPDHPCSRPSTTDTQASVVSGPGELLCDYYSTTEALVEYLVCLLEEPVVAGFDQRPTLPANVQDVASIPSLPELKACDATCREWLAHHGLLYATPGHSSYAVIYGAWMGWRERIWCVYHTHGSILLYLVHTQHRCDCEPVGISGSTQLGSVA